MVIRDTCDHMEPFEDRGGPRHGPEGRLPVRRNGSHIRSMMAWPKPEQETSRTPSRPSAFISLARS